MNLCLQAAIIFLCCISFAGCFRRKENIQRPPFNERYNEYWKNPGEDLKETQRQYPCGNDEFVNYEALCNGIRNCRNGRDEIDPKCNGECGWENPDGVCKYNNSIYFIPNVLPWTVQVGDEKELSHCQGTLITNNLVITPATCVIRNGKVVEQIAVRFDMAITTDRQHIQATYFICKRIRVHRKFMVDPNYDIALIKVPQIEEYNKFFVRPTCSYQPAVNEAGCLNTLIYGGKIDHCKLIII